MLLGATDLLPKGTCHFSKKRRSTEALTTFCISERHVKEEAHQPHPPQRLGNLSQTRRESVRWCDSVATLFVLQQATINHARGKMIGHLDFRGIFWHSTSCQGLLLCATTDRQSSPCQHLETFQSALFTTSTLRLGTRPRNNWTLCRAGITAGLSWPRMSPAREPLDSVDLRRLPCTKTDRSRQATASASPSHFFLRLRCCIRRLLGMSAAFRTAAC